VSEKVRTYLVRIWQSEKKTILLVTHDIDEAIYMSDRILVMTPAPGRIDRKIEIDLSRPRDRTSESFLRLRSDILDHLHLAGKTTADASA
jgi:ABC-type nitrate/sulfonate/bicarbonate transport system ATPase subunit